MPKQTKNITGCTVVLRIFLGINCAESGVTLDAAAVTNSVPSAVVKSSAALNAFTAVVVDVVAVSASDVLKCLFFNAIRY